MRVLIILTILLQLIVAQQHDESHLKCSHSKTAKATLKNYTAPTAVQNDYDVTFYDMDLQIFPDEQSVHGIVGVHGKSLTTSLETVDLDLFSGLTVNSVKNSNGDNLTFTHGSNLLSITLVIPVSSGNSFNVIVEYDGKPQSSGLGSFGFHQHNGQPMIWSLSEPYGARDWWPCKDTPTDKADSVDISLKVPIGLIAASNGKLAETEINGDWTTYHWQERYPIATYLVSVAIHPYTVFYDWYKYSPTDSMRLEYYVFPDSYDNVQYNYGLTNDMMVAMAQRFGEYPFIKEKYGHAEFTWGGGMEHQTLTSLGGYSEGLIAHELGHQWWGDMVTCASFHDIWLNEGFATYSEALWYELRDNDMQSLHREMSYNKYLGPGSIYVEDTTSVSRIFHGGLSYAKGSWILHMLRHVVGDDNFFNGIQEYGGRYRFKSAVTKQFSDVMEEVSGMNLEPFFLRWIYGEYYPIYDVKYNFDSDSLNILIEQTQSSDVFEMPIDIKVNYSDQTNELFVIQNFERMQSFSVPLSSGKTFASLEIDPDEWILREIVDIKLDTTNNLTIPNEFKLFPVYPNPFNAEVTIRFELNKEGDVQFSIFDINGNRVWKESTNYAAGNHVIKWNGKNQFGNKLPSGTYFVEVESNGVVKMQKMLHLK